MKQFFEYGACSTIATEDAPARRCSILVTTPYQEQAQLIHQTAGQLFPMYAVRNLVEVRTVASAQGHDADITIHGFTRTDGKGLSNDKKLAAVAESRAKYLAVYILPGNATVGSKIAAVHRYCLSSQAIGLRTYWSNSACKKCGMIHEEACPSCDIKGCKNKREHLKYSCSMRWKTQAVMQKTIPLEEMKIILDNRESEPEEEPTMTTIMKDMETRMNGNFNSMVEPIGKEVAKLRADVYELFSRLLRIKAAIEKIKTVPDGCVQQTATHNPARTEHRTKPFSHAASSRRHNPGDERRPGGHPGVRNG